jgi:hypothetical protein
MNARLMPSFILVCLVAVVAASLLQGQPPQVPPADSGASSTGYDRQIQDNAARMLQEGQQIFRFDTFGSEDFWGGKLRLQTKLTWMTRRPRPRS